MQSKRQVLTINSSATSANIALLDGWNKISINYGAGAAGTITPKYLPKFDSTVQAVSIPAPVSANSVTANAAWDMSGPGFIQFVSTGVSGTITIIIDWLKD